ncbi:metallophosphoesterase [Bryobacter aggregatus]|uniref:metallophosphoesterase n=1 Tax=Bryobacter aggregatus TaxID=360054 RepID=UPI00068F7B3C|nr:metallophosphoesterase [Bryobacter aggregatus]
MKLTRGTFLAGVLGEFTGALDHTALFDLWSNWSLAQGPIVVGEPPAIELPLQDKSLRFAVIGDNGTGARPQYEVGSLMAKTRAKFPFEFVLMMGDNIYGRKSKSAFKRKFEDPYKTLLEDGVKFYASLGNHDDPNEIYYQPFHMGGKRYYNWKSGNAEFFALDSTYMNPAQLTWIEEKLRESSAAWKFCFFHHALYSDGRFHGPDLDLRARLEPIFVKYGVAVVFNGHEHFYERLQPQKEIHYFVVGNSGQLRRGNIRPGPNLAKGFDTDQAFLIAEVVGKEFYFQTISRSGNTVDSGMIPLHR